MLCDRQGRPVAVRMFGGKTADPESFTEIVEVIKDHLGINKLVPVGDRGMTTTAPIDALREVNNNPKTPTYFDWITALRAPAIAKLARDNGPLQMSLFSSLPRLPRQALDRRRNTALAAERARQRQDLLAATEKELAALPA